MGTTDLNYFKYLCLFDVAMMNVMDEIIGNITSELTANGYSDNMLLIFTSDVRIFSMDDLNGSQY